MSDQFYATIAGSLVTLLGVLATLRWAQISHERNLSHERQKLKDEREFTARHLAYAEAAEACVRFLQYYLGMADRALPMEGLIPEQVAKLSIALNKLHFYAGLSSIETAVELGRILNTSYTTALKAKLPVAFIDEDFKICRGQIENLEQCNARLHSEILALMTSDPRSGVIVSHRDQLAVNYRTIAEWHGEQSERLTKRYAATEACRDQIMKSIPAISTAQRDLLVLARKELGFDLDASRYATFMDRETGLMISQLDSFMGEVRAMVAEKLA